MICLRGAARLRPAKRELRTDESSAHSFFNRVIDSITWGCSSVGQSACFASRMSRVRLPSAPPCTIRPTGLRYMASHLRDVNRGSELVHGPPHFAQRSVPREALMLWKYFLYVGCASRCEPRERSGAFLLHLG